MESLLPQTYLLGLIGLLAIVAVVVGRQFLRVRRDEQTLIRLEQADAAGSRDSGDLYELASVQLRKRLYSQATATLRQAVKRLSNEPQEARALIQNALGFSLAAQKDFSTAIRHYKLALQAKAAGLSRRSQQSCLCRRTPAQRDAACELYQKVLNLEPNNATAKKRLRRLKKPPIARQAAVRSKSSRITTELGWEGLLNRNSLEPG